MKQNKLSNSEKVLELEYNYIMSTVNQAVDDRYKMLNFYIALSTAIASIIVAILSLSKDKINPKVMVSIGFLTLGIAIVGWIFLATMIRLRQAWFESIRALNQVKNFFITNSELNLNEAFIWEARTIPKPERFWNIHFYSSLLIILLNSIFLTVSFLLLFSQIFTNNIYLVTLAPIPFISICVQVTLYKLALKRNL